MPSLGFPRSVLFAPARRLARHGRDWWRGETADTFFDLTLPSLNAVLTAAGADPLAADPAETATGPAGAARYVVGLLASSPRLRRRFPGALTGGPAGAFARRLADSARVLGIPPAGAAHVAAAFAARPGWRPRRAFEMREDLRAAFPLGLTPRGRGDYLGWLLTDGANDFGVTPEAAVWMLFELDEDQARGLAETYRWTPEWQSAVPDALAPAGWAELKRWVRERYGFNGRWLRAARPPAPDPDPPAVTVFSHFRFPSGLQVEAEHIADALALSGLRVVKRDVPVNGLAGDPDGPGRYDALESAPVSLFKLGASVPFDTVHRRAGLHARAGVYRVAGWSWELEQFPPEYAARATLADEVWVPSEFCATAVRRVVTDRPVLAMPPGVPTPPGGPLPRAKFGVPDGAFLVLFLFDMASSMDRKNPLGLIRAFRRAFRPGEPAHLLVKVSRGDTSPADLRRLRAEAHARITIVDELMPRADVVGLMAACDCYASLHRAEGFGLTVAEAMLLGKPVVSTNYSATTEFLTPETGLPVDYRLIPVESEYQPDVRGAGWAEPDEDHAAARLRWVYENREAARELGGRARRHAETVLNPAAAGRRMADRVRALLAARPGVAAC